MFRYRSGLLLITILYLLSFTPLVATKREDHEQVKATLRSQEVNAVEEQLVIGGLADVNTIVSAATACEGPTEGCSTRHREEKERLLSRIARDRGTWDDNHPRWRLLKAIDGFRSYRQANKAEVDRWRNAYRHVGKDQKKLLESTVNYRQKLNDLDHLIDRNGLLCDAIAQHALAYYDIPEAELARFVRDEEKAGRRQQQQPERVGVVQALKHYVRDWSAEGARERDPTFPCLLRTLARLYPNRGGGGGNNNASAPRPRVLLPGAGLGRLGYEVAEMGASPTTPRPPTSNVLLVEGDFTTVFFARNDDDTEQQQYDIIITYFFLDTARNPLTYLETIRRLLRPGGHWLNLGPLLYGTAAQVQLSLDEMVLVSSALGFKFLMDGLDPAACGAPTFPDDEEGEGPLGKVRGLKEVVYGSNARGLTTSSYVAQSWVARKAE